MLLSCSLICSSTVTLATSGGSGGATTSAMLQTKCFSPFLAHVGVSDAAADPNPDTAWRVRPNMPLGGGGVSFLRPSIARRADEDQPQREWEGKGIGLMVKRRLSGARGIARRS
jgi:hypothetical protein